jgi:hypothetical protein
VDAEHAEPADEGIDGHLEDVREHVLRRSGSAAQRLGRGALAAQESGGFASPGFGSSLTMMSSSSATPAPVRAETKQTGIRWPSRSACSSGACSSEASTSPR